MAEEHKDEQLTARQRLEQHCTEKAQFIAFSKLDLTDLTELEILGYSKSKLTYLANANNIKSAGYSAVILREKLIARRTALLAFLEEARRNPDPPDPNELAAPPTGDNANNDAPQDQGRGDDINAGLGEDQQAPTNNAPTGVQGNEGDDTLQTQGTPYQGGEINSTSPTDPTNVWNQFSIDISAMVKENMEQAGHLKLYDMLADKEDERKHEAEEREAQYQVMMADREEELRRILLTNNWKHRTSTSNITTCSECYLP